MFSFPVYAFASVILRGLNYGRLLGVLECWEWSEKLGEKGIK